MPFYHLLCLVAQSCPTLCNPMDYSLPGSFVHGILQGRILEWVPISPPGSLPNLGIEPRSSSFQMDSLPSESPGKPFLSFGPLVKFTVSSLFYPRITGDITVSVIFSNLIALLISWYL